MGKRKRKWPKGMKPKLHQLYNAYNRRNHTTTDGIIENEVLNNLSTLSSFWVPPPLKIRVLNCR